VSGARITIAGLSLPLTPSGHDPGTADTPALHRASPGRNLMDHSTGEPAGPATSDVSVGGFRVRGPRPPRRPAPSSPAPSSPAPAPPRPAQQHRPNPQPKAARPALRLVSAPTKPPAPTPQPQPQPKDVEGPWRYWVSVTFTDGHTGATLELRRTAPIITSDDRRAVADGISAHLQRPVASISFITPITRPNTVTGEPEPDIPPNVATLPADDAQPWRYRVNFATDTGRGNCEVDRSAPIQTYDDIAAVQSAISAHSGRKVVAIESFSVVCAPAPTGPRSI
jgi:hypothetical protein